MNKHTRRPATMMRWSLGLFFFFLLSLMACSNKDEATANKPQMPVPNVKIAQALSQDVTAWDEYTGRIEAVSSVDVRARVSGYLEKVNFKAGELVKKGDLLFQIDAKPFAAQLDFSEAELARAKAKHELAKNDLGRAERLFSGKAISEEEHDARTKGSEETLAAVQSATANVASAKLNLDYTKIRAPIEGRIARELITEGNLVGGGGADATLLTFIVSVDPIYVYADVDERSALKYRRLAIHEGNRARPVPVQLGVADETEFLHLGHIDYISPRADITTGTVSVRGILANTDGLLSPGFFARLRVRGSAPYSALLVPDRAIATDQAQRFVWVVNQEQKVEYRQVVLGSLVGQLRVITQGLKTDDWVVIEGIQKLMPGFQVNAERISLVEPKGEK